MTQLEDADRAEVWRQMAAACPEFTRLHDPMDDYHRLREIVLGGSLTWRGAHARFQPAPGKKVMDVGANAGIYTAFCALKGAEVVAYEPDPSSYAVLRKMVLDASLTNVLALNQAVTEHSGECRFIGHQSENRFNGGTPCDGVADWEFDQEYSRSVQCISFAEAIGDGEWDCVKMDIEGAEYEALLAAPVESLKRIKFMYLELHPWANQQLYERLVSMLSGVFHLEGYWSDSLQRWDAVYLSK